MDKAQKPFNSKSLDAKQIILHISHCTESGVIFAYILLNIWLIKSILNKKVHVFMRGVFYVTPFLYNSPFFKEFMKTH
jgi:hypothetical protein